jgi:hypothetical protein
MPLTVTGICSLLAYHNVRHIILWQISVVRRWLDHQLTAMVLARVVCLIILGFPYIIYALYQLNLTFTGNNYMKIAIATLISSISDSLMYANFSVDSSWFFLKFKIIKTHFLDHFLCVFIYIIMFSSTSKNIL